MTQFANRTGKLLKGGEPDLNTVGKMVLYDWQRGRIPYFELPEGYDNDNDHHHHLHNDDAKKKKKKDRGGGGGEEEEEDEGEMGEVGGLVAVGDVEAREGEQVGGTRSHHHSR